MHVLHQPHLTMMVPKNYMNYLYLNYESENIFILYFYFGHKHGVTMIYDRWNHSQAPPKKTPHLSYTHNNKARHKFLTSSPNKRSFREKIQRIRINCVRLTPPRCIFLIQYTICSEPFVSCRIVRLFMHF